MSRGVGVLWAGLLWLSLCAASLAGESTRDYQPDPLSVQRYGPAYRYPQAGWIVLHVEGQPYERGYQHGRLMSSEIAAFVRCFATVQNSSTPSEGWKNTRTLTNALFVRKYEKEYLEEMKGIADGATAAGAKFDNRPIDLVDIVAINSWPEIESLDSALEATANGLEGARFPHEQPKNLPAPKPMHCSAFAATGPATADGKIVIGHITMFGLYPSLYYNVWLDVKPAQGHRVFMQSYPGGVQSGMDYYYNDAGLVVCETTIGQTPFAADGMTEGSRIRKALQYSDNIDGAVEFLRKGNNGLYTNEWLLGDTKTNEIAMYELGTNKSKLYRSSKQEWYGGTEGFYWGCNNTKDLDVRLETLASTQDRPANVVWRPSDRDKTWLRLYQKYRGHIDVSFGKEAFTTPPIAAYHSLDAKFTTTDMAKEFKTWALFGPPLGRTWQPRAEEQKRFPDIRPMVSNPWTVLHANPPSKSDEAVVVDLGKESRPAREETADRRERRRNRESLPPWQGTLLPKTDADVWLAAGFADYARIVEEEKKRDDTPVRGRNNEPDRRLGLALFGYRSGYGMAVRNGEDTPLANIRPEIDRDGWYRVANGKGVFLLHELRQVLGGKDFEDLMEKFGKAYGGQMVSTEQFRQFLAKNTKKDLNGFFDYWLRQPGLPTVRLAEVQVKPDGKGFVVEGTIQRDEKVPASRLELTVETSAADTTKSLALDGPRTKFSIRVDASPRRLVVDKYGRTPKANGPTYTVFSFMAELDRTLIVYGTADEAPSNKEAAEALQQAIRESGPNVTVLVKTDQEVTDDELKSHHLLLIGRPDSNRLVERFRQALPVQFGSRSFTVDNKHYAHAGTAVIAAADNPLDRRFSVVILAGLNAESTWNTPSLLIHRGQNRSAQVMIYPKGDRPEALVLPAAELVKDFEKAGEEKTASAAKK